MQKRSGELMSAPQGYENLVPYVEGLCSQWRTARIDYVARVSSGLQLNSAGPLRICDLACGPGLSALLQAVTNPRYEVVGIDFNPTHIRTARERAATHAVTNVRFINRGVEDMDGVDLGEFDLITMSGSYSWLAPEVRRAVRVFVHRYLKPGGYFGVHAMTQPGWGSVEPLWKIARELAAPNENDPGKRHSAAIAMFKELKESGFLKNHPIAAKRVEKIAEMTSQAFAHEYMTAHWRPEYYIDMARIFADEAGLVYVGDCMNLWRNLSAIKSPRWATKLLTDISDQNVRETILDFLVLAMDRHALFHKGQIPPAQTGALGTTPLGTLAAFGRKLADGMTTGAGKLKLEEERYRAVLAAVQDQSRSVSEIISDPMCSKFERKQVAEAIGLLSAAELLVPFVRSTEYRNVEGIAKFDLSPFNRAQLSRPIQGALCVVASPVLGHGLAIGDVDVRFIAGLVSVGRSGIGNWLRQQFRGATLNRKEGQKLEGEALIKHLLSEFEVFCKDKLPKLVELEILLPV